MAKETIIVKGLKKIPSAKGDMLAVSINGNREATIAAWHKQEQDFVEKDVGIGGNFIGEVLTKGQYTNIENIDFDSANKAVGEKVAVEKIEEPRGVTNCPLPSVADERGNSIIAQCLTKAYYRKVEPKNSNEVLETYRFYLGELNG